MTDAQKEIIIEEQYAKDLKTFTVDGVGIDEVGNKIMMTFFRVNPYRPIVKKIILDQQDKVVSEDKIPVQGAEGKSPELLRTIEICAIMDKDDFEIFAGKLSVFAKDIRAKRVK